MAGNCVFKCSAPQSRAYHPTLRFDRFARRVRATSDNHRADGARGDGRSLGQAHRDDRRAEDGGEAGKGAREETKPTGTNPAADDDAGHAGKASEKVD